MRVYEFAKEKGITSAAVMKLAEACDVEVYSALSLLESDDIETLDRQFLRDDPAGLKAEAASVAKRRRAKAAKAAAAQAEKDKAQAEALEAARQRALAVHNGLAAKPSASATAPSLKPKKKEPALEIDA
ncbi:MAG: translation initiation factor IF-2 N-terminal domain-containing protein, partial [Kiritimatiellae bacterium]|nr:translation initiation factor IF-2 N-terminal domain-containing protein [Kiritimatiellia bacterium]